MVFHILGIANKKPLFSQKDQQLISSSSVFSGGKRHFQLVSDLLPKHYHWISITSPMDEVFLQYEKVNEDIVVFASGNPLFYGFANTLRNRYPYAKIYTRPYFSSIHLLANYTNTNINHLSCVSIHGRSWKALDTALIEQRPLIGVLTDASKNPSAIAQRMLDYGYNHYKMIVGEDLQGTHHKIQRLTLNQALDKSYHLLNCVLLFCEQKKKKFFGIKDSDFIGLQGRPKMITKMPVRLTTLHLLNVLNIKVLWDIGFCTGSIVIEAKFKNPNLDIIAFEKRPECQEILQKNQQQFGIPYIETVMGDFFDQSLTDFLKPDAIFIGGHGGKLSELLIKLDQFINLGTIVVINTVQEKSKQVFISTVKHLRWNLLEQIHITLDENNPICLLKAEKI